MDHSLRKKLTSMGFQIEQGSNHYKIWHPEINGVFSLAVSASDHREGLNFASCICRNINEKRNHHEEKKEI